MPSRAQPASAPTDAVPDLACACATVRRASRLVSQLYGNHLREHDTEPAQMALLMVLDRWPGKSQVALTKMAGMDKTSLSRNLSLLKRKGIVESATVQGQRELGFFLTTAGQRRFKAAKPGWSRAQGELRAAMTAKEWNAMWKTFTTLSRVASQLALTS